LKKSVVIVGAGLGGLSAAIHCRLNGHDVVLLEQGRVGGKAGRIAEGGYTLDPGPSIIILTEIYKKVFRDAGRNPDDYLQFERLNPITRVMFRGESIDIPDGYEAAQRLIDQVAPEDSKEFAIMWAKLSKIAPLVEKTVFAHPYDKPWQLADPSLIKFALPFDVRKTYKELVDGMFKSSLLRAFFYGFPSYGGQSYRSKAPGALLIPYFMLQDGVWYPKGGVAAIPEAFARLATELGVEIRTGTQVVGFESADGRVRSAVLASGEKVSGEAFVCNRDRVQTQTWLGRTLPSKPSYSYFTVHMGVRREFPELKHHTLFVPDEFESGFEQLYEERVFPSSPIVYLNNSSDTDSAVAPPGCSNLFAVVTSPANEDHLDWPALTDSCVQRTLQVMSKAGVSIEPSEIEMQRVQTPVYFEQEHGNFRGSLYGADEKHRLFGMFPWSNRDPEFRNLLYVGGSVQPGAGLPMVTLSGKFAAQMV
jgi:phytoene desaturase